MKERLPVLLLNLLLLLLIASCSKEEEVLVPDNIAPPDQTVENITIESYVNRIYIGLLGRKPLQNEFDQAFSTLQQANFDSTSRNIVLDAILGTNEFYDNLFIQNKEMLLNGVDTIDINDNLFLFNLLLQDSSYINVWDLLEVEIDRMESLLSVPSQLKTGTIDEIEMHRRMLNNYVYDEINMGTQNFVISCFQNLLLRYPTENELANGELMVEGFSASLFLENGDSKSDFMDIFFASLDYYEGQARSVFLRYLFREPSSQEAANMANTYKSGGSFQALLKIVLASDEYAGV